MGKRGTARHGLAHRDVAAVLSCGSPGEVTEGMRGGRRGALNDGTETTETTLSCTPKGSGPGLTDIPARRSRAHPLGGMSPTTAGRLRRRWPVVDDGVMGGTSGRGWDDSAKIAPV